MAYKYRTRAWVFWAMMALLIISVPVVLVGGYLGFRKLTFSYGYCGSYGEFDSELGWRLKPNASSCLSLRNHLTGRVFFDTTIYTNSLGFRDSAPLQHVDNPGVIAIGDSWTFGYGVNYEDTYPHLLSRLTMEPVANMGIPAYGAGSTLLHFSRNISKLRPKAVVYFTAGLWTRSICDSDAPEDTLIPCFRHDRGSGAVELVTPRPGAVDAAIRDRRYPGGSLLTGYDSLFSYMIWVKGRQVLNLAVGLLNGVTRIRTPTGSTSATPVDIEPILRTELLRYAELARQRNFTFVLFDPKEDYRHAVDDARAAAAGRLIYLGSSEWTRISTQMQKLPPERARVPRDGHFGLGANQLIADEVFRALQRGGIYP